ncbi:MAG: hypothetical protein V1810_00085 [Candidatus Beckwithbacteria bacterium]
MPEIDTFLIKDEGLEKKIETVMTGEGLSLAALASQGVIACDVEYGPEIAILAEYNPKILIATEPDSAFHHDRKEITRVLGLQAGKFPDLKIIRDFATNALEQLHQNDPQLRVGLITRLYMFSDYYGYNSVISFLRATDKLLFPGGVILASLEVMDNEVSHGVPFFRAGTQILKFELGYDTRWPVIEYPDEHSGQPWLVAIKPKTGS